MVATVLDLSKVELDPKVQSRVNINIEIVEEYAEEMRNGADFPPVEVVWDEGADKGWVWDGFHRVMAAQSIEVSWLMANVVPGTREEARWRALGANAAHGLRRTNEDKRRVVALALKHPKGSKMSDRQIARHCGVHHSTVSSIRRELESTGEIRQSDLRTGADGRTIDVSNIGGHSSTPSTEIDDRVTDILEPVLIAEIDPGDEKATEISTSSVSVLPAEIDVSEYLEQGTGGNGSGHPDEGAPDTTTPTPLGGTKAENGFITFGTGEPVGTYTDPAIVEAVQDCLGEIDLNPCIGRHTGAEIPATVQLGPEDDGLSRPWHGRVGLTPPHGHMIRYWIEKLCKEYQVGRTTETVVIVPARTDDDWWQAITEWAAAVCFIAWKYRQSEREHRSAQPLVAFYLGENAPVFYRAFASLGSVWARVEIPIEEAMA
jgi:hypothetical protein